MKNLSVLLKLKKEKHQHVVLEENGSYSGMSTGSKGVVKVTDEAIAHELFGEYPLSEENFGNFRLLTKMKLAKVKKAKDAKTDSKSQQNLSADSKKQIGKAA